MRMTIIWKVLIFMMMLSTFQFSQAKTPVNIGDIIEIPFNIGDMSEIEDKKKIREVVSIFLGTLYTVINELDIQNDTARVSASINNLNCKFILVKEEISNRVDGTDWLVEKLECLEK